MSENETRVTGWPAHRVTGVDVWPFCIRDGNTVNAEPLFDPEGSRIKA